MRSVACRNEVVGWLASIGAEKNVPTKKQKGLPTLSEEQWEQLQPKAGRAAIVAKEPTSVQHKEPVSKAKEPSSNVKEACAAKPKDTTAVPKPQSRPRYNACICTNLMPCLASLAELMCLCWFWKVLLHTVC